MTKLEYINNYIKQHKELETDEISDGYHTLGELYFHRMILFSTVCKAYKNKSWRSRKHSDGKYPFDNECWFIVGVETPEGQYTYHYHMQYWDHFKEIEEIEKAYEWDGHQPKDIIRLKSLGD